MVHPSRALLAVSSLPSCFSALLARALAALWRGVCKPQNASDITEQTNEAEVSSHTPSKNRTDPPSSKTMQAAALVEVVPTPMAVLVLVMAVFHFTLDLKNSSAETSMVTALTHGSLLQLIDSKHSYSITRLPGRVNVGRHAVLKLAQLARGTQLHRCLIPKKWPRNCEFESQWRSEKSFFKSKLVAR